MYFDSNLNLFKCFFTITESARTGYIADISQNNMMISNLADKN